MIKKITTEKDIPLHDFRVKIGTVDRKNPETIYVECGTYIKPKEHKNSYIDDVHEIKKIIRDNIKNMLHDSELFTTDYICTIDIPIERITPNRKTYISFDYTLKQKNNIQFYDLVKEHKSFVDKIVIDLTETLIECGFILSKGKK